MGRRGRASRFRRWGEEPVSSPLWVADPSRPVARRRDLARPDPLRRRRLLSSPARIRGGALAPAPAAGENLREPSPAKLLVREPAHPPRFLHGDLPAIDCAQKVMEHALPGAGTAEDPST